MKKLIIENTAEKRKHNDPLKTQLEALLKKGAEFSKMTFIMSASQRKAFSDAIRSWNSEISQIIKSL